VYLQCVRSCDGGEKKKRFNAAQEFSFIPRKLAYLGVFAGACYCDMTGKNLGANDEVNIHLKFNILPYSRINALIIPEDSGH
jgi:hypothetical protein